MIIPLFIEQFLLLLVGMADTFVVSFVGDAAVSGVSLVNSFNTVAIFLFSAPRIRRRCNNQSVYRQQR